MYVCVNNGDGMQGRHGAVKCVLTVCVLMADAEVRGVTRRECGIKCARGRRVGCVNSGDWENVKNGNSWCGECAA